MRKPAKTVAIAALGLLIGAPLGVSTATFVFADGFSYLSGNPKACVNCHIMQENFDAWKNSSHHSIATCNDCHTSGSVVSKYGQKALNGFLHSWAFSTGLFEEPIRIKGFNRKIVLSNCVRCHDQLGESSRFGHSGFATRNCLDCHQNSGHRKW